MKTLEERLNENIHWINEEDTIQQIIDETKAWLIEHRDDYENNSRKEGLDPIVSGIYRLAGTTCNGLINQLHTSVGGKELKK